MQGLPQQRLLTSTHTFGVSGEKTFAICTVATYRRLNSLYGLDAWSMLSKLMMPKTSTSS